jgi:hypothetical protein
MMMAENIANSLPVLLLNFSHPLTLSHISQLENLSGNQIAEVRAFPVQFDPAQSFPAQVQSLINTIDLSSEQWQTLPILVNPPSLNAIAVTLLAELHGRMGYFPPVIRLKPVNGSIPPQFEVAEIINLQSVREQSRQKR